MTGRQVEVVPGNHVVAAAYGAVVVVPHREALRLTSDSKAFQTWLELHRLIVDAIAKEDDRFGPVFTRLVAAWATERAGDMEFGVLSPAADGYSALLRGGLEAVVAYDGKTETLRADHQPAPQVNAIGSGATRVAIYVVDQGKSPIGLSAERGIGSLVQGVAQGSGAVVWLAKAQAPAKPAPQELPTAERAPAPKPAPRPAELKPPKIFETFKPDDKPPPRRPPLPVKPDSAGAATADRSRKGVSARRVRGVKCARGHFNDPRVAFCRLCGLRMNQTKAFSEGERPPLGFLVLDDGTTLILGSDVVVGREPEKSSSVRRGAMPIRLADNAGRLSRAHAEFRLIEWDVTVVDLGSTNGTFVRPPGQEAWHRVPPERPYLLLPGAEVQIGGRRVTFDSPHAHV